MAQSGPEVKLDLSAALTLAAPIDARTPQLSSAATTPSPTSLHSVHDPLMHVYPTNLRILFAQAYARETSGDGAGKDALLATLSAEEMALYDPYKADVARARRESLRTVEEADLSPTDRGASPASVQSPRPPAVLLNTAPGAPVVTSYDILKRASTTGAKPAAAKDEKTKKSSCCFGKF